MSDVEILRPTVAANGNHRLFYDVVNRGRKLGFTIFNDNGLINNLAKAGDAGNGFLMNRGYTVVWSGWQGDVRPGGGLLTFSAPTVPQVTGLSREEFIFDHTDNPADAALTYPAADLDPAHATLTVREREADPRVPPATCHSDLMAQIEYRSRGRQALTQAQYTNSPILLETRK
jgi:hypothetical protein